MDCIKSLKSTVCAFSLVETNQKVISYAMWFSRICPKIRVNPKYKHFMFEINRQTYSPQMTELAQNYLTKRANK